MPGWPEFAFCTASMDRARMAFAMSLRLAPASGPGAGFVCALLMISTTAFGASHARVEESADI